MLNFVFIKYPPTLFAVLALSFLLAACETRPVDVIKAALPLEQATEAASAGKAVYATGKITAGDRGDPHFVKAGAHLLIQRRGEIMAWVKKTRQVKREVDGKEKTVEEPGCELEWTTEPDTDINDNDWCERESDEQNLRRRFFKDNERTADLKITVNEREFTVTGRPVYINLPDLSLTKRDMVQPFHLHEGYFYHGSFDAENPEVGTERVRFLGKEYDREAEYTVIGALEGDEFRPLKIDGKEYLFLGAGGIDAVIAKANE